jgi:hypothetical protein
MRTVHHDIANPAGKTHNTKNSQFSSSSCVLTATTTVKPGDQRTIAPIEQWPIFDPHLDVTPSLDVQQDE